MNSRSAPNRDDTGPLAKAAIAARLACLPDVQRALVFGSRGRGYNAPRADIDLAVSCPGVDERRWAEIEADTLVVDATIQRFECSVELL